MNLIYGGMKCNNITGILIALHSIQNIKKSFLFSYTLTVIMC